MDSINLKNSSLDTLIEKCPECDKKRNFKIVGKIGVPWKPVCVYKCEDCGYKIKLENNSYIRI